MDLSKVFVRFMNYDHVQIIIGCINKSENVIITFILPETVFSPINI
jgi:hypothetical protein